MSRISSYRFRKAFHRDLGRLHSKGLRKVQGNQAQQPGRNKACPQKDRMFSEEGSCQGPMCGPSGPMGGRLECPGNYVGPCCVHSIGACCSSPCGDCGVIHGARGGVAGSYFSCGHGCIGGCTSGLCGSCCGPFCG